MELVCYKYNEKMTFENACCRHTGDYCKYRTSCIIHFMEIDREKNGSSVQDDLDPEDRTEGKKA